MTQETCKHGMFLSGYCPECEIESAEYNRNLMTISAAVMQGMLAGSTTNIKVEDIDFDRLASTSVQAADALLKQLNKGDE